MAQAALVIPRVRRIHELLAETGWINQKMPREVFDSAIALYLGVVGDNARIHISAGETLGLWTRSNGGTRRGTIRILASQPQVAPQALPIMA